MTKSDTWCISIWGVALCTFLSPGSFFSQLLLFDGLFCTLYCSLSIINRDDNCSASWMVHHCYICLVTSSLFFPDSLHRHLHWSITSSYWRNCLIQDRHESGADSFCMSYGHTEDINQRGWWLRFEVTQHVAACFDKNSSHCSYQRPTVFSIQTIWQPTHNLCSAAVGNTWLTIG